VQPKFQASSSCAEATASKVAFALASFMGFNGSVPNGPSARKANIAQAASKKINVDIPTYYAFEK
jgi:hypothetical protein